MLRWLGIVIAIGLMSSTADAQVFRPKAGKKAKTEEKAAPEKKAAKKQPRAAPAKKRVVTPKQKTKARPEEEEADEPAPKPSDKDYVKIWDDEEIE